jgi:hypothetical protein
MCFYAEPLNGVKGAMWTARLPNLLLDLCRILPWVLGGSRNLCNDAKISSVQWIIESIFSFGGVGRLVVMKAAS